MPRQIQLKSGITLTIEDKAFASGGEGDLFRIISPENFINQVVKIYFPVKRTKEKEQKIDFLIANPPNLQNQNGHHSVIWASQTVYENGKFIGFVMPLAKGEKLEILCYPKLPNSLNHEWKKFDYQEQKSIELRLKVCFNIAVALYEIHRLGNYVLMDMKPENIMIQTNGLISIIDIDSLEISKNGQVLFPAPVTTPEYTPPEYYKGIKSSQSSVSENWDRFSFAVICYRLLCGIHPFVGSCNIPFDKCNDLSEMVKNGLFPNGKKASIFKVIPPPHNNFKKLDKQIQELFLRCFDDGHNSPDLRPSAEDWCRILSPLPTVGINRLLPSSFVKLPNYQLAQKLTFEVSTSIEFPKKERTNTFQTLIIKMFSFLDKKGLISDMELQHKKIKDMELQQVEFQKALQNIIDRFNENQQNILNNEIKKYTVLKSLFQNDLSESDKLAESLSILEVANLKDLQTQYAVILQNLETKLQENYKQYILPLLTSYEQEKQKLVTQQYVLNEQKIKEYEKKIKEIPNKLSLFKIAPNIEKIFGAKLSAVSIELLLNNFYTAADFIDIANDGSLLDKNNKWTKVKGVSYKRASDLLSWRNNLIANETELAKKEIDKIFNTQLTAISQEIIQITGSFNNLIEPHKNQYEQQKKILTNEKNEIIRNFETKKIELIQAFDTKHNNIKQKTQQLESLFNSKLFELNKITNEELSDNLQNSKSLYSQKIREIEEFIEIYVKEMETLKQLQRKYTSFLNRF